MKTHTLRIKNMCCDRCIRVVTEELISLGLKVEQVQLGTALIVFSKEIKMKSISERLHHSGFELLNAADDILVEKVKFAVIEIINHLPISESFNYSKYISEKVELQYKSISKIFTHHHKMNIEKFIILHRIEKTKELIQDGEKTFSEIAFELGYKTSQHLSSQFKSITGITMSVFKKKKNKNRISIDTI